jgi:membrane protein DedA with SNARE-associated domain
MAYVITALIAAAAGMILGYLICWRNPPESLKKKLLEKL